MNVLSPNGRLRLLWMIWIVVPCCCGTVGCAVGGRSVSIDSNSRVPFFGLELKERKSSGPPIHSIRHDEKSSVRLDPLGLSRGISSITRLGEKWDRKSGPLAPVALPLTDSNSVREEAAVEIDFR